MQERKCCYKRYEILQIILVQNIIKNCKTNKNNRYFEKMLFCSTLESYIATIASYDGAYRKINGMGHN